MIYKVILNFFSSSIMSIVIDIISIISFVFSVYAIYGTNKIKKQFKKKIKFPDVHAQLSLNIKQMLKIIDKLKNLEKEETQIKFNEFNVIITRTHASLHQSNKFFDTELKEMIHMHKLPEKITSSEECWDAYKKLNYINEYLGKTIEDFPNQ